MSADNKLSFKNVTVNKNQKQRRVQSPEKKDLRAENRYPVMAEILIKNKQYIGNCSTVNISSGGIKLNKPMPEELLTDIDITKALEMTFVYESTSKKYNFSFTGFIQPGDSSRIIFDSRGQKIMSKFLVEIFNK